jgi:hypothetical protein
VYWSLIADDVLGRAASAAHGCIEHGTELFGGRLREEHAGCDDEAGEVVEHSDNVKNEWPAQSEGKREPRHPEAEADGHRGQVDVPDVVRVASRNDARRGAACRLGSGERPGWYRSDTGPFREPLDGARSQDNARAGEQLSDAHLAHGRQGGFELLDELGDKVGEAIDGSSHLDERLLALVVEALHPGGNGGRGQEEAARGSGSAQAGCGAEGEDGKPLGGRIERALARRDLLHPGILDAELLAEQGVLGAEGADLCGETGSCEGTVLEAGARLDDGGAGERNRVDERAPDDSRPAAGDRNVCTGPATLSREKSVILEHRKQVASAKIEDGVRVTTSREQRQTDVALAPTIGQTLVRDVRELRLPYGAR